MDHLEQLEYISIHILREAYANFKSLGMLWSIGKDSTVLLWLVRKAFFGHVPFPLIHIDTFYNTRDDCVPGPTHERVEAEHDLWGQ
jgi:sulfate adenylyltransferase subunit 2